MEHVTPRNFGERRPKVSVLIPMYNEQEVLDPLFGRLNAVMDANPQYEWEVLLVNDGSRDNSLLIAIRHHLADPRWHYLDLSRNWGKETAMMAGFDYVTGDCTVIMDADLQHPPEAIPQMLEAWLEGYDDVYGSRLTRGEEPWLRRGALAALLQPARALDTPAGAEECGRFPLPRPRMCRGPAPSAREPAVYQGALQLDRIPQERHPVRTGGTQGGETKWNFLSLLNLAIEGMTSYTTAPLRVASVAGVTVSLLAFVYMTYILIKTLLYGDDVQGFPTIIIVMLFLGGVILLALGVIGEYVGRIFIETKRRPGYLVRDYDGNGTDRKPQH